MNKLIEAPCLKCNKQACGAYHDECPLYQEYVSKMHGFKKKREQEVENTITEGKKRFWADVRKKGIKIT